MKLIPHGIKTVGAIAAAIALSFSASGCSDKSTSSDQPAVKAPSAQDDARSQYVAEAPPSAEQCKRNPNEIFRDRKRRESLEGWAKIVGKDCPRYVANPQTHQISVYFNGERFLAALSEYSVRKGEAQFGVDEVTKISPECRREQRRLKSCVDSGKELLVCLEGVSKPAPENCPTTVD